MVFIVDLLKSQYTVSIPYPEVSFEGQTVIVTGSNIGLGLEAARHAVRLNAAKVIIACRTTSKGEEAKKSIEESTKRTGVIEVWKLDLSSYASVKEFASQANTLPRLDVLLENAGISTRKFEMSEDNESTITTNVVSTFLLALLLLPKLKETAATYNTTPRLTIVTSELHEMADLQERKDKSGRIFDTMNDPKRGNMSSRYNNSKLLEILILRQIVETCAPAGYPVILNLTAPGFCRSSLAREMGVAANAMYIALHARTTEVGSRCLVHAIQAGKESHGKYMRNAQVHEVSCWVRSEEGKKTQGRVWTELSEKLEVISPGILQNF
jgi:retinol dehydrogenase-12